MAAHVLGNPGGPPPPGRNEVLLREAVDRLRLQLDAARECRDRLTDVVEALRHHGAPYRWHEEAWNQALLLAESAQADYKDMGGK